MKRLLLPLLLLAASGCGPQRTKMPPTAELREPNNDPVPIAEIKKALPELTLEESDGGIYLTNHSDCEVDLNNYTSPLTEPYPIRTFTPHEQRILAPRERTVLSDKNASENEEKKSAKMQTVSSETLFIYQNTASEQARSIAMSAEKAIYDAQESTINFHVTATNAGTQALDITNSIFSYRMLAQEGEMRTMKPLGKRKFNIDGMHLNRSKTGKSNDLSKSITLAATEQLPFVFREKVVNPPLLLQKVYLELALFAKEEHMQGQQGRGQLLGYLCQEVEFQQK